MQTEKTMWNSLDRRPRQGNQNESKGHKMMNYSIGKISQHVVSSNIHSKLGYGQSRRRLSADAVSAKDIEEAVVMANTLAVGAGRFWGVEKMILEDFQQRCPGSIKSAQTGFMSPYSVGVPAHPTFEQVCEGCIGYVEVLFIELNNPEEHFEELVRFIFQIHDPTTRYRQGTHRGFQFGSWIFCADEAQRQLVKHTVHQLQQWIDNETITCYERNKIVTKVCGMREFTPAGEEHQQYHSKTPGTECDHKLLFDYWPIKSEASVTSSTKRFTFSHSSNLSVSSFSARDSDRELVLERYRRKCQRQERIRSIQVYFLDQP